MIGDIIKKIFGTKNERFLKRLWPTVHRINEREQQLQELSEEELQNKTQEFKDRLQNGETTEDILEEAYAVVVNACRRIYGREIEVTDHKMAWDMVPFNVQILGAIALHQGNITEMATGEGKTLVATMPLYLNALTGRNCQLVTVNDYLARRDAQWMGGLYNYLGLSVGCLQHDMGPEQRKAEYAKDITYGTNAQFGFDYLRDMGMATSPEEIVQRDYFFVIIDEIDSILIDEARTPLIISGPASVSTHKFEELKPAIEKLYQRQTKICAEMVKEVHQVLENMEEYDENTVDEAVLKACVARMGMPKQQQLLRVLELPGVRRRIERKENELHSDNNRGYLQEVREDLYFTMDERGGEADLTEKGRRELAPNDPNAFVMPDLAETLSEIDGDTTLTEDEKRDKKEQAQKNFDDQSEKLHNISQLLRAYCLFEMDVQYVVQDNKVIIVDENTGRLMPGRRFSEGLHQALEAKEGVQIEKESQTFASITIQNYFRMYDKLAGMTGTAETEAHEFKETYGLDVVVVPTNEPCIRVDNDDKVFKTKREKYDAIADEVEECQKRGQPVLLGTISVDVSETLSRILNRRRIPHNVLNAKHHQSEAEVIARAGERGTVTIATNMAGRGTDIKLGEGVTDVGGLRVIGSERHDSRRIDRQLRGRCARQGDPGSSRFYLSFEDDLMRLFAPDKVSTIMDKVGFQEGEELSHRMLSRVIEKAQRRVEQQHFSVRKRTLEYDDVVNKQRQVIYNLRREILTAESCREKLFDFVYTTVSEKLETFQEPASDSSSGPRLDKDAVLAWLHRTFPIQFSYEDLELEEDQSYADIAERIVDRVDETYQLKEKNEDEELTRYMEREIMLHGIDKNYREHLYAIDHLREGVQLRAYAQKDPLIEYKQEAFGMFSALMDNIKQDILEQMFRSSVTASGLELIEGGAEQEQHEALEQFAAMVAGAEGEEAEEEGLPKVEPVRRESPKVGRNDACPCGSNKKYKKCCGQ